MTDQLDRLDAPPGGEPNPAATTEIRKPWWRRLGIFPPALLSLVFFSYALPPYLGLDPSKARIANLRQDIWWHYPALVLHIACGTIAFTSVVLQLSPWIIRKHPKLHRVSGRVYIYAGVVPGGVLALLITPFAGGPVGDAMEGGLWLIFTFVALRAVRRRQFAKHRRFMIYSYALCAQIIWGRILIIGLLIFFPEVIQHSFGLVLETASWIGTFINLAIAQWWLERTAKKGYVLPRPEKPTRLTTAAGGPLPHV
ncbi:hypothetical protein AMES_5476 [Amycolatopsis mediterranei S699]|uniref:DUF2306 domain-containing protein n=2 Tax=Amycolatopsis mediterranei TaxID=33910 RepID=A0A0H3D9J9_AMYMU|nr:DUF2306 domain-containing protein [Amycolatopsis mediterranei]ADJ47301.1 conserved hypothetical protein [Amycolatopsis mediterranei U32]AEK44129.1 hypothetical protein RAM_28260 [Amycolatopsis mediterranei S699]AFO79012.1 hypothetical protein AMES_5476 [Amycolatopsis mediterranei S699]AGT86140.1 hypothetical protein B737_5476 [Amycolatopsis mediterranei RB]KDO12512.1 hypothetical protein DV26_02380 [Amycolatopsis mediterranei]